MTYMQHKLNISKLDENFCFIYIVLLKQDIMESSMINNYNRNKFFISVIY